MTNESNPMCLVHGCLNFGCQTLKPNPYSLIFIGSCVEPKFKDVLQLVLKVGIAPRLYTFIRHYGDGPSGPTETHTTGKLG
ncbi:hypothetical protein VNO80_15641 [Phaseolus coccineus]|uniref:Uncharacterized protein n=1 Tax=Phaseolus coccineus TaxID=3886 RepID=A0AAN9MK76_PHACN